MIRSIYTYGENILRDKAVDVDLNDPELPGIIEDLFDTMRNANGAGLAAPQIGISKKIVVIEETLGDLETFRLVLINPRITVVYNQYPSEYEEGCLSIPGISEKVSRTQVIELTWWDENKEYKQNTFTGLKACIIQHEVDHLDGTLYIDRLHPDVRLSLFNQLEDIRNKNVTTTYPII